VAGVLHQDGFLLRERVIGVYARRGAQNAESLLEYSNKQKYRITESKFTFWYDTVRI
jgi:hypothetical protein